MSVLASFPDVKTRLLALVAFIIVPVALITIVLAWGRISPSPAASIANGGKRAATTRRRRASGCAARPGLCSRLPRARRAKPRTAAGATRCSTMWSPPTFVMRRSASTSMTDARASAPKLLNSRISLPRSVSDCAPNPESRLLQAHRLPLEFLAIRVKAFWLFRLTRPKPRARNGRRRR